MTTLYFSAILKYIFVLEWIMKRLALTVVIVLLAVCCGLGGAVAINKLFPSEETIDFAWDKIRVADESLYPDNFEYIDYAEEVKFDYEKYPLLKNQGLFWCRWDDEANMIIKVDATTPEGASIVDPNKPTIINIHGMLNEGYFMEEMYWAPPTNATAEELGYEYPVQMFQFWMDKGYNVGMYSYQKFASEEFSYHFIEEKMWATDGPTGIRYQKPDRSFDEDVSEYTITEHFAADYIRAMRLLPDNFGDKEIRFAAHSMGGQMLNGGTFLLTELASVGQLNPNQLPDRITMEDTFFGIAIPSGNTYNFAGYTDLTVRWSGKKLPISTGFASVECMKDLAANGIVVEFVTYEGSALLAFYHPDITKTIKEISVFVLMQPYFTADGGGQHNGVREYYLSSIIRDYEGEGLTDVEKIAFSASLPTEELKNYIGRSFKIVEGGTTLMTYDDVFVEITDKK